MTPPNWKTRAEADAAVRERLDILNEAEREKEECNDALGEAQAELDCLEEEDFSDEDMRNAEKELDACENALEFAIQEHDAAERNYRDIVATRREYFLGWTPDPPRCVYPKNGVGQLVPIG